MGVEGAPAPGAEILFQPPAGPVALWRQEPHCSSAPEGLSLIDRASAEAFLKMCILWEGLTLEKFVKDCLPQETPHAGAQKAQEEERAGRGKSSRVDVE